MSDDVVSLFTLMDMHLSKTRISEVSLENDENKTESPSDNIVLPVPPGPRLSIPQFFPGSSPMKDFLAQQIANTIKAKERREQEEEQKKLDEQMKKLKLEEERKEKIRKVKLKKEQEYLIDLSDAIIPQVKSSQTITQQPLKGQNSKTIVPVAKRVVDQSPPNIRLLFDKETCRFKAWDPSLPCTTDMSYILKKKLKRGKASSFGKVFCSRMPSIHHISIPYVQKMSNYYIAKLTFKTKLSGMKTVTIPMGPIVDESSVVRFDFSTKSPGDIYLEKQKLYEENFRKPKMSSRYVPDIMDFID